MASDLPATTQGWGARAASYFAVDDVWVRRPPSGALRADGLLAVGFVAIAALGLELVRSAGGLGPHMVWAEYLVIVAMAAPILVRRRFPVGAALAASLAFFVAGVTLPTVALQLSVQVTYFFSLFSAMAWARSRRTVLAAMGAILVLMFGWIAVQFSVGSAIDQVREQIGSAASTGFLGPVAATIIYSVLVNAFYFGGAVVGGQAAWRAARSRARLADQAARLVAQAGQIREHAVVKERLHIARELHDVVAHHVSVMGVQAAAARRVMQRDPAAAAVALSSVEESGRVAVSQMRSLVGTLRAGPGVDRAAVVAGGAGGAGGAGDLRGRSPVPGVRD
ncbi:MAG: histidine kinase dimerization/phosphoacceptor domain-containing protein, partial [Actinomycetota bacterium]|nr:histidine kinase dimerization/phosphoacceptor domain-containing protein [Actinomycetota bacterium]